MDAQELPNDTFWHRMKDSGVLDESLVNEYKRTLSERPWLPLGRIMIDQGLLNMRQMAGLLGMQSEEPDLRLGDLAIREEYCTAADIAECLAIQAKGAPGPIEMMLKDARLDHDKLYETLVGYISFLEGRNRWLTDQMRVAF